MFSALMGCVCVCGGGGGGGAVAVTWCFTPSQPVRIYRGVGEGAGGGVGGTENHFLKKKKKKKKERKKENEKRKEKNIYIKTHGAKSFTELVRFQTSAERSQAGLLP